MAVESFLRVPLEVLSSPAVVFFSFVMHSSTSSSVICSRISISSSR